MKMIAHDYWLNKLFFDLQKPEQVRAFNENRRAVWDRYPLSPAVRAALEADDVTALARLGPNPYLLRFYCQIVGFKDDAFMDRVRAADPTARLGG